MTRNSSAGRCAGRSAAFAPSRPRDCDSLDAAAFNTFCGALALSLAAWLYQLGLPEYAQAISSPHRLRIGLCFVLTAGVLGALRFGAAAPHSSARHPDRGRP